MLNIGTNSQIILFSENVESKKCKMSWFRQQFQWIDTARESQIFVDFYVIKIHAKDKDFVTGQTIITAQIFDQ